MIDSLVSLTAAAVLTLAAFGLGRPVVRALGDDDEPGFEAYVWSLGVGWTLLGTVIGALGWLALLYPTLIVALALVAMIWGLVELLSDWLLAEVSGWGRGAPPESASAARFQPQETWLTWAALGALAASAGALVSALAPPTAGDALCYHLEVPKTFLAEHRLVASADCAETTYPLLAEMTYLAALALDGPEAAQLVHWEMGLLLAAAAVVLARPLVGASWAWIVGLVVLTAPAVSNQMTAPLNDAALAALATLALAGWRRIVEEGATYGRAALTGIVAGGALATKYLALMLLLAVAAVAWAELLRRPLARRDVLRGATLVAVVAASFAGPWYLRAAWHRGNPVYPFFDGALGGAAPDKLPQHKRPLALAPLDALRAPWSITFEPDRFGGRGHQPGPLFLAVLPALWTARRLRGLAALGAVALAYAVLWYALRQNARFLLPIAPIAALAAVWSVVEMARFPTVPRRLAWTAVGLLLALGAAWPAYRARQAWRVALGRESRAEYLLAHEPTFLAALAANTDWRPGDRLLSQDYRGYYFQLPVVREKPYRERTAYDQRLASHRSIAGQLIERGFSHVLLAEAEGQGIRYEPTLSRLLGDELRRGEAARCLVDYRFVDADGATRRYRLVQLR